MEIQAERLGDLQKFLGAAPFVPAVVVGAVVGAAWLAVGWVESLPL